MWMGSSAESASSRVWSQTKNAAARQKTRARTVAVPERNAFSSSALRRRIARTGSEGVPREGGQRRKAVLEPDLLALGVGAAEVGHRHLEDPEPPARHLRGDLRVHSEPRR